MSLAPFVCWERDGIALGGIDGGGGVGRRGEERQREGRGSGREKTMRRATTRMGRQGTKEDDEGKVSTVTNSTWNHSKEMI